MAESRDNSGALFKAKPNENPNWPGYSGKAVIGGTEYWISGWLKESDVAGKYFSLSFKLKDGAAPAPKPAARKADPEDDDRIPF